jgi:hypothetical protein
MTALAAIVEETSRYSPTIGTGRETRAAAKVIAKIAGFHARSSGAPHTSIGFPAEVVGDMMGGPCLKL